MMDIHEQTAANPHPAKPEPDSQSGHRFLNQSDEADRP